MRQRAVVIPKTIDEALGILYADLLPYLEVSPQSLGALRAYVETMERKFECSWLDKRKYF